MLCSLARWQLSSALDRRGERPRRCAAHLARCASCQEFAGKLQALHGRLSATAKSAPPPALVPHRRWLRPAMVGGLALAAGAALYLLAPAGQPAREPEAPVAVSPETTPDTQPETPQPPATEPGDHGRSIALTEQDPPGSGAPASRGHDALERLSVLFTAPPRLRAELDALASDGRRGALAILGLGGVGPRDQRVR